jgi:hypothetical protein
MTKLTRLPFLLAALSACGPSGGTNNEQSAGGENRPHRQSARELIGIHPPEHPWAEMSHEDKEMDMVGRFLPIMTEIFQEQDARNYGNFGCETCHGPDMRERNFQMPGTHLPPVGPAGSPAYRQMAQQMPEMVHFMEESVTPTMQTMLGLGAAFTCNGCHPTSAAHTALQPGSDWTAASMPAARF